MRALVTLAMMLLVIIACFQNEGKKIQYQKVEKVLLTQAQKDSVTFWNDEGLNYILSEMKVYDHFRKYGIVGFKQPDGVDTVYIGDSCTYDIYKNGKKYPDWEEDDKKLVVEVISRFIYSKEKMERMKKGKSEYFRCVLKSDKYDGDSVIANYVIVYFKR